MAVVELCLCGREEDVRRRDLAGLADAPDTALLAEALHLLCRTRGRLERCMYGSWGDGVDTLGRRSQFGIVGEGRR